MLARASATLAVVAEALLQARQWGAEDEVRVCQVWEAIEVRLPRSDVRDRGGHRELDAAAA